MKYSLAALFTFIIICERLFHQRSMNEADTSVYHRKCCLLIKDVCGQIVFVPEDGTFGF